MTRLNTYENWIPYINNIVEKHQTFEKKYCPGLSIKSAYS